MQHPSKTHKDEPCDICGNVGYGEVIATCSKCRIAHEHVYCMRVYAKELPEDWVCEGCLLSNDLVSPKSGRKEGFLDSSDRVCHDFMQSTGPSKGVTDLGRQIHSKRNKAAETGKVKMLSIEEVISLSSGAPKNESPSRSRTVTPKFSHRRVTANRSTVSSGLLKPGAQRSSMNLRPAITSKESKEQKSHDTPAKEYGYKEQSLAAHIYAKKGKAIDANMEYSMNKAPCAPSRFMHCRPIINTEGRVLATPIKDHVGKEQPVEALIPAKEVKTSITKTKKTMDKISCTPSPSRLSTPNINLGQNFHSVAEPKNSDVEEREQLYLQYLPEPKNSDVEEGEQLYLQYLPSLHATWKGGFKFSDTVTPGEFYGGFQAQPPCRVHRKSYEFSQKMPLILQVKLLPRCNLWTELFQNACPDFHDIALYFLPADNIERSKQNYANLFELMETQNSVMISYIDGVELLIFTSKQLHVDSQDVTGLNTKLFLWGLFRRAKNGQILREEIPLIVSPLEDAHDCQSNMDNSGAIDMEIDMVGGRIVGVVDKVVSKDSSGGVCGTSEKEIVDEITLQKSDGKISTLTKDLDSTIQQLLLEECNDHDLAARLTQKITSKLPFEQLLQRSPGKLPNATEDKDIPPGFEKMLNSKSVLCKATYTKEKPCLVDKRVTNPVKRGNIGLQGVSGRDFGAGSSQPQRSMEDSNIQGLLKRQEPARDLAYDPLAAYRSPLLEKESRSGLKIKVEGNDEKPIEVGLKKGFDGTPFFKVGSSQSTTGSFNSEVSTRDKIGYPQSVEVKAEVRDFAYYRDDFSRELHTKSPSKIEAPVRWTPPPTDWVKLNTEGCSKGNPGAARAGGVIRDESGKWVLGYTFSVGTCTSLAADFWALFQGLQIVWDKGFRNVLVESVSNMVVKYLEKVPSAFDPNRAMIECCRDLLKHDWNCKVNHINREANLCANWLATHFEDHARLTIFKSPPPDMIPLLQNDCVGIAEPLSASS